MKTTLIKASTAAGIAAVVMGIAAIAPIAYAATLTSAQISAIESLLSSFGADPGTIANVQAALNGTSVSGSTVMQVSPSTSTVGGVVNPGTVMGVSPTCTFNTTLTLGSVGSTVSCLQQWLINNGYRIPAGATGTFGPQTKTAVASWQKSNGLPSTGYFGLLSRQTIMKVSPGGSTTMGATTSVSGGNTLNAQMSTVNSEVQGLNSDLSSTDANLNQNDQAQ